MHVLLHLGQIGRTIDLINFCTSIAFASVRACLSLFWNRSLETTDLPTPTEATTLKQSHFNYRQAIGEAIYAMVTCRPDISYAVIKLAQYSINPALIHYQAVRHLFRYLALTKSRGIHYWRKHPVKQLDQIPHKNTITNSDILSTFPDTAMPQSIHSYVDSDWGNDKVHR